MLRYRNVILFIILIYFQACNQSDDVKTFPNTPTSGVLDIEADPGLSFVLPPQIELFTSIYKNTHLNYKFKSETECINDLLNDSCKIIFLNRPLNKQEEIFFKTKNIIIQQTMIAYSAIALMSQSFQEHGISIDTLRNILSGKNNNYKIIFFGKSNGSTIYCKDSILQKKDFGKNCFAVNDTAAFAEYIKKNSKAIGIIDYSLICDDDDKKIYHLKYPNKDTLLIPVRKNKLHPAYYPDQSNIGTKDYPLIHPIYCIRKGDNFSLSAGFEAFIAGEKGQVFFKKMGLVPVFDRERKIQLNPY